MAPPGDAGATGANLRHWPYCFSDKKIVDNPVFVPDRCNNNDDSIAPNLNQVLTNELGITSV